MNKIEIIKTFLRDPELMAKYGITSDDIDALTLSGTSSNPIVALLQQAVTIIENETYTVNTAAANLNSFLENRLRGI